MMLHEEYKSIISFVLRSDSLFFFQGLLIHSGQDYDLFFFTFFFYFLNFQDCISNND